MTGYDRCRCRAGCLAPITADDDVVLAADGYALTEHALPAFPQEPLPLDVQERVS